MIHISIFTSKIIRRFYRAFIKYSESSEKIRKKEESKESSEGKDKHLKKDEIKEEDTIDKKDRKYYKVTINWLKNYSISCNKCIVMSLI